MNISYLEISALNMSALAIAYKIALNGFVYHDITILAVGVLGIAYCLFRAAHSLKIWCNATDKNKLGL